MNNNCDKKEAALRAQYPKWAPWKLIQHSHLYLDGYASKEDVDYVRPLICILCTNSRMEKVWDSFWALLVVDNDYFRGRFALDFLSELTWALRGKTGWHNLTRKEVKDKKDSLAKQLNAMAKELELYPFCPTFDVFPPALLRQLRLTDKDYEYLPNVSVLLRGLAAKVVDFEPVIENKSTNSKDGKLNFFLKVLAVFLKENLCGDRDLPYESLIILAEIFYPEYEGRLDVKNIKEKVHPRKSTKKQTQK